MEGDYKWLSLFCGMMTVFGIASIFTPYERGINDIFREMSVNRETPKANDPQNARATISHGVRLYLRNADFKFIADCV